MLVVEGFLCKTRGEIREIARGGADTAGGVHIYRRPQGLERASTSFTFAACCLQVFSCVQYLILLSHSAESPWRCWNME
jgi:hypothetical protein